MKTTLSIACLLCMLSFNGYTQGNFRAHLHIAAPSTIFGGGDLDGFYGVIDYDDPFGYAGLGLGIGLEYQHPFGDKGLSGLVSLDLFRNGIQRTYKEQYKKDIQEFPGTHKTKFSAYYNIPILVGVNYDLTIKNLPFFIQGGPLLDFMKVSKTKKTTTYSSGDESVGLNTYAPSISFGFGIRAGVTLNDKYILGLGYTSLGVHSFSSTYYNNWGEENVPSFTNTEVKKIGLIKFSFGIQW